MKPQDHSAPAPQGKPKDPTGASFLADLRGSAPVIDGVPASRSRARLTSNAFLSLSLMAISVGALYGMRVYGKRAGMSMNRFDTNITQVRNDPAARAQTAKIMAELDQFGTPVQVPAERVKRDPFTMKVFVDPGAPDDAGEKISAEERRRIAELARKAREERQLELTTALESLEIKGIMMGRVPLARINEKLFRTGDKVAGLFIIQEISERSVTLSCDDGNFVLELKQAIGSDGKPVDQDTGSARDARPGTR